MKIKKQDENIKYAEHHSVAALWGSALEWVTPSVCEYNAGHEKF